MATIVRDFASATYKESHFYADGTSGDDANDGLTVGTPVKTFERVQEVIPDIITKNTCLHLSGTFTYATYPVLRKFIENGTFVIDGGDDVTILAGPLTSDIASTSSIGLTTAGWTPDAYKGYWVEILDGPAAGQIRTVYANTATTITPVKNFSVSPIAGAQFRIVKPTTLINGYLSVNLDAKSTFYAQRFRVTGYGVGAGYANRAAFSGVIHEAGSGPFYCVGVNELSFDKAIKNPITFATDALKVMNSSCVSSNTITVYDSRMVFVLGFVSNAPLVFTGCNLWYFGQGFRLSKLKLENCITSAENGLILQNNAGYAQSKIDSSADVGLVIQSSVVGSNAIQINDCASHGIELKNNGFLNIQQAIAGTGNGGAGVYAHANSSVRIKSGVTPTITGTVGELSTDGTTQASTWAAVAGGTPVVDLLELCTIKAE